VREPGGTAAAEEIRRILLGRGEGPSMRAESLLYHAARADLYDRVVLPALARNGIVVSERSLYSTLAYQGFGAGEPIPALRDAGLFAVKGRLPDRVILLDLPVQNGLSRIRGAKDRLESRSLEFHRRMRRGFLSLARREPRRFRVVSAAGSVSAVARRVRRALSDVLG
jgi:dTMP kinase